MSDFDSKKARASVSDTFGIKDSAPAYSAWAKMQDKELQERRGDGYSAWEHMADSVAGLPEQVRMYGQDMYNGGLQQNGKLRDNLNNMRDIADKQGAGSKLNRQERDQLNAWEMLLQNGKVPSGY